MVSKNTRLKQTWLSVKGANNFTYERNKRRRYSFIVAGLLTVLAMPAYACKIPKSYYKHVSCTASDRYFLAVRDSGDPVALLNKQGKKAVDLSRYTQVDVNNFNGELLPVQRTGKVGYINMSGREVVPAIYDVIIGDPLTSGWARPVSDNRIVVKKNGKFGIINTNNEVILPFSVNYQSISNYKSSVAKIVKNGETIWVDKRARKIEAPREAIQSQFIESGFIEPKADKSGTSINNSSQSSGNYVSKANNRPAKNEVWKAVKRDGKWGFVNSKNIPMITFSFDDVTPFSEGLAGVRVDENWGFVNPAGDLVIPFRFDEAGVIRNKGSTYQGEPPFVFKKGKAWIGNLTNGIKLCIDKEGTNVSCDN